MRPLPPPLARTGLSIALAALLLSASCGAGDSVIAAPEDPGERVRGRTFLSTKVTRDGRPYSLVDGTRVRLAFTEDGRLLADAGCNSMQGAVDLSSGTIAVEDLAQTEMGCAQALHEQDAWLAGLLGGRPTWRLEGDELVVTGGTTALTLLDRKVADPDRPLLGTLWIVDTFVDGEVASSLPSAADATVQIVEDGVLGSTGCNEFRGGATVSGSTIEFGELTTTRRACEPELAEVERHMLAVLDGDVRFEIEGERLRLDHPGGMGLVLHADNAGVGKAGPGDAGSGDAGSGDAGPEPASPEPASPEPASPEPAGRDDVGDDGAEKAG
jgi:heat shock protein HslJ